MSTDKISALVEQMANERAKEILTEVACDLQELSETILAKALAIEGKAPEKPSEGRPNRGKWALMCLKWRKDSGFTQKQAAALIESHSKVQVRQYNLSVFEKGNRMDLDLEVRHAIQDYLEEMDI